MTRLAWLTTCAMALAAVCSAALLTNASAHGVSTPPPTPPDCHWSDHGGGKIALWCRDSSGDYHPTGQVEAANLGSGDGCPAGTFYNGVQCVGALRSSIDLDRVRLSPRQKAEHGRFLTGLARSLDEVVAADSASWLVFRYDRGSMAGAKTLIHGADRRSALVYGEYTYNGGQRGWVKARIASGRYTCLQYWNESRCRAIGHPESHQLVAGLLLAMFAGASSGSGSSSGRSNDILVTRSGYSPSPAPEPAPMTPIGGNGGLYGADHSCC